MYEFKVVKLSDSCAFSTFNSLANKVTQLPDGTVVFSYLTGSNSEYTSQFINLDFRNPETLERTAVWNRNWSCNAPCIHTADNGDLWCGIQEIIGQIWGGYYPNNTSQAIWFSDGESSGHGKFSAAWDEVNKKYYVFGGHGKLCKFGYGGIETVTYPFSNSEYTGIKVNEDGELDLIGTYAAYSGSNARYSGTYYRKGDNPYFLIVQEFNAFVTDFIRVGDTLHVSYWSSPQTPAFGNPSTFVIGYRRFKVSTGELELEIKPLLDLTYGGSVGHILTKRGDDLYLIAGVHDHLVAVKSTDNGETWTIVSETQTSPFNAPQCLYTVSGGVGGPNEIFGSVTLWPFTAETWSGLPTGVGVPASTYGFRLDLN